MSKIDDAILALLDTVPGEDFLNGLITHANRRGIVLTKLHDRFMRFTELVKNSYNYVPPELGLAIGIAGGEFCNTWEEFGECLIESGADADAIGSTYRDFFAALIEAAKED